ncbi:MAG TPA: DUF167 domain-containing protein [Thermoanaerobaculia bacterium]|nr:DUF167 domain-containing protein [Thermoanaerobaculia bacterium]
MAGQPPFVRPIAGGIELALKVVPGASRPGIVGVLGDRLKVRVAAPPERGKANREVVALLRDWLGTKRVAIVAGHGRAEKTARVEGLAGIDERRLAALKASV